MQPAGQPALQQMSCVGMRSPFLFFIRGQDTYPLDIRASVLFRRRSEQLAASAALWSAARVVTGESVNPPTARLKREIFWTLSHTRRVVARRNDLPACAKHPAQQPIRLSLNEIADLCFSSTLSCSSENAKGYRSKSALHAKSIAG